MGDKRWSVEIGLVGAALFIASVIWLIAKQGSLATERVTVPVQVENTPDNVDLKWTPKQVSIIVQFPQSQRSRVVAQNFTIILDAQEIFGADPRTWASAGQAMLHSHNLTLDNIHTELPQSIRVLAPNLQSRVQIEATLITRTAKVEVTTTGSLPEQFEMRSDPEARPAELLMTAPDEIFRSLAEKGPLSISTNPIVLDGHAQDFIDFPGLKIPAGLELVDETDRRVEVTVRVKEIDVERKITDVPIEIFVFTEALQANVSPAVGDVVVRGKFSVIGKINSGSFTFSAGELLAEELGLKTNVRLEVQLAETLPDRIRQDIEILGFSPQRVDVEFVARDGANPESL